MNKEQWQETFDGIDKAFDEMTPEEEENFKKIDKKLFKRPFNYYINIIPLYFWFSIYGKYGSFDFEIFKINERNSLFKIRFNWRKYKELFFHLQFIYKLDVVYNGFWEITWNKSIDYTY